MLQCLNNVPPLLSHQHQKLQSSSHCFHCSTTCSPTYTHAHTRSFCDYPHLCSSQSPPPLPLTTLSISVTERTTPHPLPFPPLSLFLSFSPSSISPIHSLVTQPAGLRCCSQGAVCSNMRPGPTRKGNPKASICCTVQPGTHTLAPTASETLRGGDMFLRLHGCNGIKKRCTDVL